MRVVKSGLHCEIQESALIRRTWNESLMLFIRPNPGAWAWGYRSVVQSSTLRAVASGRKQIRPGALSLSLLCLFVSDPFPDGGTSEYHSRAREAQFFGT
jgi:hypothetical protein